MSNPQSFSPKNPPKNLQLPGKSPTAKQRTCQATKADGLLVKCTSALWWHAACQSNVCLWET